MTQKKERRQPTPAPAQKSPWERYRALILGGVAILAVLVVALVLFRTSTVEAYTCDSLLTPAPVQADASGIGFPTAYLGNQHVTAGSTIKYGFCAPTSGNHYSSPQRGPIPAALYGPGSQQAPGGWVHNLEHGYVVLLYRCPSGVPGQGDCATTDEMDHVNEWFNDAPTDPACGTRKAVAARFDSMSTDFAVLAWNRALLIDTFDNAGLGEADNFTEQWTDTSAPEPNNC